ncbi:MAG: hypothetical protein DRG25_03245 [Deltaproteobacteria bacterium]|nr:MAG: hypothetical protein DRG25_03245 [Deltaproteobacteria bacterium]
MKVKVIKMKTKSFFVTILFSVSFLFTSLLYAGDLEDRVENSIAVLNEIMKIPEKGIPTDLFDRCSAIAIFPHVVKGGFIFGGRFGRGVISVHDKKTGKWSPPAFFTLGGGSYGFQVGVQAIDLVLLIMTKRGLEGLLKSKVTLGGDLGVAAGPVGRRTEAGIDILLKAEIFSYSRAKGIFAGISLEGATIFQDKDANRAFYGKELSAQEILLEGKAKPPLIAQTLINTLIKYSSRK